MLTFLIVSFMLMPSTEEVVKLSPPLESSTMLVNLLLNQPFKNLFSLLKLLLQLMLWVVFITVLTPEEVLLMRRNKLQELHSTSSELIYLSLNHSVSLLTLEVSLKVKPSHNVSLTTGKTSTVIHLKLEANHKTLSSQSEREKPSNQSYHPSMISLIDRKSVV